MFSVGHDRDVSLAFVLSETWFCLFARKTPDAGEICHFSLIWAILIEYSTLFRNVFDEQKVHSLCYRIVQFYFFPVRRKKVKRKLSMSQIEVIRNNWP